MIESICSNSLSRICMAERKIFVKGQCEPFQIISWFWYTICQDQFSRQNKHSVAL